jgi:tRNA 2-thiouridine synthesizing protein B
VLHLIFQTSIETAVLERTETGDALVFLENAVLKTLQQGALAVVLAQRLKTHRLYVLSNDLLARGIAADELVKGIEVIDYAELVALTVEHTVILSWS